MTTFSYILLFTFLSSVASLIGGIVLLYREDLTKHISHFLISFAAGTLLGTVFFDLLPEAAQSQADYDIFFWTLIGIVFFFLAERFLSWFHHHQYEFLETNVKPLVPLVIFGDTVHNFIDGVAIAATFLTSVPLGMVTSLAVGAHEVPQEIGDFGILLHQGFPRKKIFFINFFSALASLLGAVLTFIIGEAIHGLLPIFLAITAGFFIYIASSDLIPELHHEKSRSLAFYQSLTLLAGIQLIWVFAKLLV